MKNGLKIIALAFCSAMLLSCAVAKPQAQKPPPPETVIDKPLTDCNLFKARKRLGMPTYSYISTFPRLPFHFFQTWVYPDKDLYVFLCDGKVCKTIKISDTSNSKYYQNYLKKNEPQRNHQ